MATKTNGVQPRFTPNITVGTRGMDIAALRQMAQSEPAEFMRKIQGEIDAGRFRWENVRNIATLWQALADVPVKAYFNVMGHERAIDSTAFPLLSGGLTIAGINDAYQSVPTIGQELVRDIEDNKKISIYGSILAEDTTTTRVDEGKDFPEMGAGEEKYTIAQLRNGRRISITAEMIEENNLADIASRVNALGRSAALLVEKQTLSRVCDLYGSTASAAEPYVLHLNGTASVLYSTTANTPGTRSPSGTRVNSNALVDTTDLENARALLVSMKDDLGNRINLPWSETTLLVPDALLPTASKILNSEFEPSVENELNNWGPRGRFRPSLISSPLMDDISTTAWYLGAFQRQFVRKWKLRFEYASLGNDTESFLRNRIAAQFRVAWDCEVGAVDYVWVVQSLSATTAPVP